MPGPADVRYSRGTRPVTASLVALVLASAPCPAADLRVTPARQAQRDGLRQQILAHELASEEQAFAQAEARLAERAAAEDPQGVQEAEAARRVHARNLDTLHAEIARSGSPFLRTAAQRSSGSTDAQRVRPRAMEPNSAPANETAVPAAGASPSPRWWDAYDAPGTSATTPHAWNVYQGGPTP
jgi:hypothetical protein